MRKTVVQEIIDAAKRLTAESFREWLNDNADDHNLLKNKLTTTQPGQKPGFLFPQPNFIARLVFCQTGIIFARKSGAKQTPVWIPHGRNNRSSNYCNVCTPFVGDCAEVWRKV